MKICIPICGYVFLYFLFFLIYLFIDIVTATTSMLSASADEPWVLVTLFYPDFVCVLLLYVLT